MGAARSSASRAVESKGTGGNVVTSPVAARLIVIGASGGWNTDGRRLGPLGRLFGHAYYYDEGISRFVGGPGKRMASWLDRVFDQKIIDGTVNGIAKLFGLLGKGLSKVEDGLVRRYALGILLGTVAVVLFLLLWAGR